MTATTHHITRIFRIGAIAVAAVVAGVVLAIALTAGTTSTIAIPTSVTVNNSSCAESWTPPDSVDL